MNKSKSRGDFRLLRIGRVNVKSAVGFFVRDNAYIVVAADPEDMGSYWRTYGDARLRPMHELEQAFKDAGALRCISWVDGGIIVKPCARQVSFVYATHKVVMHIS